MIEIERKFLVTSKAYQTQAYSQAEIVQGFLSTHPERTVRVRLTGDTGFITVKGKTDPDGTTRFEWEREISAKEAKSLLEICKEGVIRKIRYRVKNGRHVVEVDEFQDHNKDLVIAEIELKRADESFIRPAWLGEEVTGDPRYYNSQLSKNPYASWKK
ncbi:CYTH domain-containing protein [Muriicola sp.]|uniref:CYTH domain-containing protein n=1 Tax=Muriicola sp. TaxID=2020856 RepID=UPI003C72776B